MEHAEEVMMSNLEMAKKGYDLFSKGDIPAFMDLHPENVVYELMGEPEIPFAGTFHGKEEVMQMFKKLNETIEFKKFEPVKFITEGDNMAVLVDTVGVVRKNGKHIDRQIMHLLKFKNGKCIELREFSDTYSLIKEL